MYQALKNEEEENSPTPTNLGEREASSTDSSANPVRLYNFREGEANGEPSAYPSNFPAPANSSLPKFPEFPTLAEDEEIPKSVEKKLNFHGKEIAEAKYKFSIIKTKVRGVHEELKEESKGIQQKVEALEESMEKLTKKVNQIHDTVARWETASILGELLRLESRQNDCQFQVNNIEHDIEVTNAGGRLADIEAEMGWYNTEEAEREDWNEEEWNDEDLERLTEQNQDSIEESESAYEAENPQAPIDEMESPVYASFDTNNAFLAAAVHVDDEIIFDLRDLQQQRRSS